MGPALNGVDLGLLRPVIQRLRHPAALLRYLYNRRAAGGMMALVVNKTSVPLARGPQVKLSR